MEYKKGKKERKKNKKTNDKKKKKKKPPQPHEAALRQPRQRGESTNVRADVGLRICVRGAKGKIGEEIRTGG